MKRYFCDCCGNEILPKSREIFNNNGNNTQMLLANRDYGRPNIELVAQLSVQPKDGHIPTGLHFDMCANCMWQVIYGLDKRPKPSTAKLLVPDHVVISIVKRIEETTQPLASTRALVEDVLRENGLF